MCTLSSTSLVNDNRCWIFLDIELGLPHPNPFSVSFYFISYFLIFSFIFFIYFFNVFTFLSFKFSFFFLFKFLVF